MKELKLADKSFHHSMELAGFSHFSDAMEESLMRFTSRS